MPARIARCTLGYLLSFAAILHICLLGASALPVADVLESRTVAAAATPVARRATSCSFSCRPFDLNGNQLLRIPGALSPTGSYSIFDCVYGAQVSIGGVQGRTQHVCSYDTKKGTRALGPSSEKHCYSTALPCPSSSIQDSEENHDGSYPKSNTSDLQDAKIPMFSSQNEHGDELKVEVLPWLTVGRELMYLKDHHQ